MEKICKICKRPIRYDKGCWRHIEGGGLYWQRCRECDWEGKLTVDDLLTVVDFYRQPLTKKFSLNVFYERR